MKNNRYTNWFFAAAVVVAGFSMAACEDEPDKYYGAQNETYIED